MENDLNESSLLFLKLLRSHGRPVPSEVFQTGWGKKKLSLLTSAGFVEYETDWTKRVQYRLTDKGKLMAELHRPVKMNQETRNVLREAEFGARLSGNKDRKKIMIEAGLISLNKKNIPKLYELTEMGKTFVQYIREQDMLTAEQYQLTRKGIEAELDAQEEALAATAPESTEETEDSPKSEEWR